MSLRDDARKLAVDAASDASENAIQKIEYSILAFAFLVVRREASEAMLAAGTLHDSSDDCSDIGADIDGIYHAMTSELLKELS